MYSVRVRAGGEAKEASRKDFSSDGKIAEALYRYTQYTLPRARSGNSGSPPYLPLPLPLPSTPFSPIACRLLPPESSHASHPLPPNTLCTLLQGIGSLRRGLWGTSVDGLWFQCRADWEGEENDCLYLLWRQAKSRYLHKTFQALVFLFF